MSQKDLNARWTKKNNPAFYGYKEYEKVNAKSKLIFRYGVTEPSVNDSHALDNLLNKKDKVQPLYADSGYKGEE